MVWQFFTKIMQLKKKSCHKKHVVWENFLYRLTLKMNSIQVVETSRTTQPTAWHHISKTGICSGTAMWLSNLMPPSGNVLCFVFVTVEFCCLCRNACYRTVLQMSLSCRLTVSYCHQWGNTKASRGGQVAHSEDTLVEGETWRWILQGEYCHVCTLHCAVSLCNTTNTMPFCITGWHIQDLEHG